MTTIEKYTPGTFFAWVALIAVLILLASYGRQAMEWFIMKLYEFFIQNNHPLE